MSVKLKQPPHLSQVTLRVDVHVIQIQHFTLRVILVRERVGVDFAACRWAVVSWMQMDYHDTMRSLFDCLSVCLFRDSVDDPAVWTVPVMTDSYCVDDPAASVDEEDGNIYNYI